MNPKSKALRHIKSADEARKLNAKFIKEGKKIGYSKDTSKGSVAFPKTDEQKRDYQRKFKRAWNE